MNNENPNLTEELLSILKKTPEGLSLDKITSSMSFQENSVVEALNELIEGNRISIIDINGENVFKYRSEKEALKFRDLTKEEMSVYELIIRSAGNGISTNDLKIKMKIDSSTFINRILKTLEKKFLIRSLKVLNTKNKKVWIGFDIEPSQEVTGGVWCSNQEYDNNLVSVFCDKSYDYISGQKTATRKEVLLFARCANLTSNDIKEEDMQKILNILVFDGKIEPIFPEIALTQYANKYAILLSKNENILSMVRYQRCKEYKPKAIFDCIPCALCPAFDECSMSNVVNPVECPHLKNFMQLH